jgi:hypothetical protein
MDVVLMHRTALPLPPRRINPDIPAPVEAAILRALEKDSALRFQSAAAFALALGCAPEPPLPLEFAAAAARLAPPVYNERGNAGDLPTRFPPPAAAAPARGRVLRVQSGARKGQIIALSRDHIIGRADVDPSDGTISRQHVRIESHNGACLLYDMSSHGTVVNGARLNQGMHCRLTPGSNIQIGQTVLVYEVSE